MALGPDGEYFKLWQIQKKSVEAEMETANLHEQALARQERERAKKSLALARALAPSQQSMIPPPLLGTPEGPRDGATVHADNEDTSCVQEKRGRTVDLRTPMEAERSWSESNEAGKENVSTDRQNMDDDYERRRDKPAQRTASGRVGRGASRPTGVREVAVEAAGAAAGDSDDSESDRVADNPPPLRGTGSRVGTDAALRVRPGNNADTETSGGGGGGGGRGGGGGSSKRQPDLKNWVYAGARESESASASASVARVLDEDDEQLVYENDPAFAVDDASANDAALDRGVDVYRDGTKEEEDKDDAADEVNGRDADWAREARIEVRADDVSERRGPAGTQRTSKASGGGSYESEDKDRSADLEATADDARGSHTKKRSAASAILAPLTYISSLWRRPRTEKQEARASAGTASSSLASRPLPQSGGSTSVSASYDREKQRRDAELEMSDLDEEDGPRTAPPPSGAHSLFRFQAQAAVVSARDREPRPWSKPDRRSQIDREELEQRRRARQQERQRPQPSTASNNAVPTSESSAASGNPIAKGFLSSTYASSRTLLSRIKQRVVAAPPSGAQDKAQTRR